MWYSSRQKIELDNRLSNIIKVIVDYKKLNNRELAEGRDGGKDLQLIVADPNEKDLTKNNEQQLCSN
jgi:hypothetical protein